MRRYENKVVMVVGAAQGIGEAVASAFAKEGASLAIFDIQDKINETGKKLKEEYNIDVLTGKVDITDYESCKRAVSETVNRFGKIDLLALTSGTLTLGSVDDMSLEIWNKVINVNLNGYFYMTKAIIPQFKKQNFGNMVLTGSWSAYAGTAYFSAYCVSKAGVIRLMHALAEELADFGVRVNCVCPGSIATSLHFNCLEEQAEAAGITVEEQKKIDYSRMAMHRPGKPSEIADAFVFLGTDEASYITGACIDVNGGGCLR